MDRKTKILSWVLIVLVVVSVGFTFYKTVIRGDFDVVTDVNSKEINN